MKKVWSLLILLHVHSVIRGNMVCLNNTLNDYDASLTISMWWDYNSCVESVIHFVLQFPEGFVSLETLGTRFIY